MSFDPFAKPVETETFDIPPMLVKDSIKNPKDKLGSNKLHMHLWPETASMLGSLALLNGKLKYGRGNYLEAPVYASIYYDAARRHLAAWFAGEECDADDGLPHLAGVLASVAIIVDAGAAGTLIDDRDYKNGHAAFRDLLTPHVARLKKLHEGRDPKNYDHRDLEAVHDDNLLQPTGDGG